MEEEYISRRYLVQGDRSLSVLLWLLDLRVVSRHLSCVSASEATTAAVLLFSQALHSSTASVSAKHPEDVSSAETGHLSVLLCL